jgi:cyclophilin family peptidyl-prolyl cis-trans isomerase
MLRDHFRKVFPLAGLAVLVLAMACGSDDDDAYVPVAPDGAAPAAAQVQLESCGEGEIVGTTRMNYTAPPAMTIDTNKSYTATFCLQKDGEFTVELYPKEAPNTVNSFVFLAREGFYNGVTFHRVIAGFMAQGGDPTGTGSGGPGYQFDNEVSPLRRHDTPGTLSMANSGVRNGKGTNGSQFFITFTDTGFLDGYNADDTPKDCAKESCHTVFGRVIEGMDVANAITIRDPATSRTPGDAIKTIIIKESG